MNHAQSFRSVAASAGNTPEEFVRGLVELLEADRSAPIRTLIITLRAMSTYIRKVQREVAEIGRDEIDAVNLSSATDELEAIVEATAQASNTILDAAETVQDVAMTLDEAPRQALIDAATRIFEACSFQDLTGQRVTKVIGALTLVEHNLAALIDVFGRGLDVARPVPAAPTDITDDTGRALCSGPQLPGDAQTQDQIDALFDSLS